MWVEPPAELVIVRAAVPGADAGTTSTCWSDAPDGTFSVVLVVAPLVLAVKVT